MCLKLHPPHLLYVSQSSSILCSDFSIISSNFPKACEDNTFTINIFAFSPFIAFGINIVKPSILAIPSPSIPLSIMSTIYSLFFSTGNFISSLPSFLSLLLLYQFFAYFSRLELCQKIKYNVYMRKLIVNEKYNNKKLNKFLQDSFPGLTSSLFYKTLRKKDIKINGKRINENVNVFEGNEILVYISDDLLFPDVQLDIVYEDENILVINKPSEIEVTGKESLTTVIHKKYSDCGFLPMPCHRLDRNTTGLVLFAKNQESLDILLEKFKQHEIEKHYLALVYGNPVKSSDKLIAYLFKDSKKSLVYISDEPKKGYSKIITSYSVLYKNSDGTCLLDVEIETGKTHQIRAHLAHIGLPIVGDGKYGDYAINRSLGYNIQQLKSYKLKFCFSSDNGVLEYLNGKEFCLN